MGVHQWPSLKFGLDCVKHKFLCINSVLITSFQVFLSLPVGFASGTIKFNYLHFFIQLSTSIFSNVQPTQCSFLNNMLCYLSCFLAYPISFCLLDWCSTKCIFVIILHIFISSSLHMLDIFLSRSCLLHMHI